jgi:hypothetical protein
MDFLLTPFACAALYSWNAEPARVSATDVPDPDIGSNGQKQRRRSLGWLSSVGFVGRSMIPGIPTPALSPRGCIRGPSFIHELTQTGSGSYGFGISRGGLKQIDQANFQIQVSTTRAPDARGEWAFK